jgi:hypothetical protein
MQHPFFTEALANQHIRTLRHEAEIEHVISAANIAGRADAKNLARATTRTFGLACFGIGLLAGGFFMNEFGLLTVIITAGCMSVLVSLLVSLHFYSFFKAHRLKGAFKQ